jgi:hypothetical protein
MSKVSYCLRYWSYHGTITASGFKLLFFNVLYSYLCRASQADLFIVRPDLH